MKQAELGSKAMIIFPISIMAISVTICCACVTGGKGGKLIDYFILALDSVSGGIGTK